ncbi:MAG: putative toxin-antitoxin system toxin component, PIN family [Gemmatimonas sp.]|nr:putative toxin-antitoxin system toxin component, PIN family [Gemmatimonas sp.]
MRVVLDTNVVVSGVMHPSSVPARVLLLVYDTRIQPVIDLRVLNEYHEVLARPKLKIPGVRASDFLRLLGDVAERVIVTEEAVSVLGSFALKDPDDRPFMEVAVSAAAEAIVTGNTSHFPEAALDPIRVLTPRQLLDELGKP